MGLIILAVIVIPLAGIVILVVLKSRKEKSQVRRKRSGPKEVPKYIGRF